MLERTRWQAERASESAETAQKNTGLAPTQGANCRGNEDFEPDLELEIPLLLPSGVRSSDDTSSLSLEASLVSDTEKHPDSDRNMVMAITDVLGSAVAESTGWRPPEQNGTN